MPINYDSLPLGHHIADSTLCKIRRKFVNEKKQSFFVVPGNLSVYFYFLYHHIVCLLDK